jgi:hypothetical protein
MSRLDLTRLERFLAMRAPGADASMQTSAQPALVKSESAESAFAHRRPIYATYKGDARTTWKICFRTMDRLCESRPVDPHARIRNGTWTTHRSWCRPPAHRRQLLACRDRTHGGYYTRWRIP